MKKINSEGPTVFNHRNLFFQTPLFCKTIIFLISLKATNYKNKVRKQTNIKYVIFDKDDTNIDQPGNVAWFHRQSRQPICSYDCAFCIAYGIKNSHRCVYTNIILCLLIFPHDAEIYLASIILYIYIYSRLNLKCIIMRPPAIMMSCHSSCDPYNLNQHEKYISPYMWSHETYGFANM